MKKNLIILSLFVFGLTSCEWALSKNESDSISKVFSRNAIEKEAKRLAESGYLDEAVLKFREATQPQYITREYQKAYSLGFISDIYRLKGDYDAALRELEWFVEVSPGKKAVPSLIERQDQLIALREYQRTENPKPVLDFLDNYKTSHRQNLPPEKYVFSSAEYISTILRLYDTIGEHDAGIAFIDEILAFFRTGKAGDPKPGRVDAEYMKVREAFEQDKAQGTKGRATKALIQSDYFPW